MQLKIRARLQQKSSGFKIKWFGFGVLILLWSVLYLPFLRTSPSWYSDECYVVYNAPRIASGQMINYALWNTFTAAHYPYQPLYSVVAGLFTLATEGDIIGPRFFNTLIALAIACVLFFLGRYRIGYYPSLFAAMVFLTYEQSVIHFRYVFAHNAAALGTVLALLYLWRKNTLQNNFLAGVGLMIAAGSHPLAINAALSAILVRLSKPLAWIQMAVPGLIYVSLTFGLLWVRFGPWVYEDAFSMAGYYKQTAGMNENLPLSNIWLFMTHDWFHATAYLCAIACCNRRYWHLSVFIAVCSFLLLRNRGNLTWFYYQAVTILPLLCLAMGVALKLALAAVRKHHLSRCYCATLRKMVFLVPGVMFVNIVGPAVSGNLVPRNAAYTTQLSTEVEECARWINENSSPSDYVIANPMLSWLLKPRVAHHLQAVAGLGVPTHGFELGLSPDRFRFDPDFRKARYFVIGDIDTRWTVGEVGVAELWKCIGAIPIEQHIQSSVPMPPEHRVVVRDIFSHIPPEVWPVVWQGPNYTVFENPRFSSFPAK